MIEVGVVACFSLHPLALDRDDTSSLAFYRLPSSIYHHYNLFFSQSTFRHTHTCLRLLHHIISRIRSIAQYIMTYLLHPRKSHFSTHVNNFSLK